MKSREVNRRNSHLWEVTRHTSPALAWKGHNREASTEAQARDVGDDGGGGRG